MGWGCWQQGHGSPGRRPHLLPGQPQPCRFVSHCGTWQLGQLKPVWLSSCWKAELSGVSNKGMEGWEEPGGASSGALAGMQASHGGT